jgi:hypothetical protein
LKRRRRLKQNRAREGADRAKGAGSAREAGLIVRMNRKMRELLGEHADDPEVMGRDVTG